MNTVSFIKTTRELIAKIESSNCSFDEKVEFQKQLNFLSANIENPTLVCLLDLVDAAKNNGLDVLCIEEKLVTINYFD